MELCTDLNGSQAFEGFGKKTSPKKQKAKPQLQTGPTKKFAFASKNKSSGQM